MVGMSVTAAARLPASREPRDRRCARPNGTVDALPDFLLLLQFFHLVGICVVQFIHALRVRQVNKRPEAVDVLGELLVYHLEHLHRLLRVYLTITARDAKKKVGVIRIIEHCLLEEAYCLFRNLKLNEVTPNPIYDGHVARIQAIRLEVVVEGLLALTFRLVEFAHLLQDARVGLSDSEKLVVPLEGSANIAHQLVHVANLENYLGMLLVA